MGWKPDVTVAAVVESRDGRFLFVEERVRHRLVINQPAGHVEDGESLMEAVVREAREETAWRFAPEALLGIYLWRNPANNRSTLRFTFTGTVSEHDAVQPLDKGIERTLWLTRDELVAREARHRSPLVLRCVDDYLRGRRLPLEAVASLDGYAATDIRAVGSI